MQTPKSMITKNAMKWAETLKKIEVINVPDGMPLMNARCHFNSINQVKLGKAVAVVEAILVGDKKATAHYINMDSNGEYYDITLGWSWAGSDYRLIRIISADNEELRDASEMLSNLKLKMYKLSSKQLRFLHLGDQWDLF
tara:strand:- start:1410 stop:1829 length:420 start_codon:yes stop_codon:yes gene_type:complete